MKSKKNNCGNVTRSQAAERLTRELGINVTPRQVQLWQSKGYPIHNAEALRQRLLNQERVPKGLRGRIANVDTSTGTQPDGPGSLLTPEELDGKLAHLQDLLLAAKDYEEARTLRTKISGIRELFRVQADRGLYILKETVHGEALRLGIENRQRWESLENLLPAMLDGLTALQMQSKLRDFVRLQIREIYESATIGGDRVELSTSTS